MFVLCHDTNNANTAPYAAGQNVNPTNANTIYIYKYFFDKGEKVQTAWAKWEFTGVKILGVKSLESFLYVMAAEGTNTKLFKIDFLCIFALRLFILSIYPTLPSRLIPTNFCASTANSIGNCCNTSLQKPFTIKPTASSELKPLC